ncbi:hypothetical protein B4U79_13943, partial [Dinothrombium tinctorium]
MAITYTIMAYVLWSSKQIGERTSRQEEGIAQKKKV